MLSLISEPAQQTDEIDLNLYNLETKRILSTLPSYLRMHWAVIVNAENGSLVSAYPEHIYLKNAYRTCTTEKDARQKGSRSVIPRIGCRRSSEEVILQSEIDERHRLITSLPSDIPLAPAKAICEHITLVLRQLPKTR